MQRVSDRVTCVADASLDASFPENYTCIANVDTTRGTFERRVDLPKGERENPMTWAEMVDKYNAIYADGEGNRILTAQ